MPYSPRPIPADESFTTLSQFLQEELEGVADALRAPDLLQLEIRNSAPERPRDGMIVFADGSDWEPVTGMGKGFYGYYSGAWTFLSAVDLTEIQNDIEALETDVEVLEAQVEAFGLIPLFTPSATAGVWTSSIFNTSVEITVDDIDDYKYLIVSIRAGVDQTPRNVVTGTVLVSEINVDATPTYLETSTAFGISVGTNTTAFILMGRNTAGTTLYFRSNSSSLDTGKILGVWGLEYVGTD